MLIRLNRANSSLPLSAIEYFTIIITVPGRESTHLLHLSPFIPQGQSLLLRHLNSLPRVAVPSLLIPFGIIPRLSAIDERGNPHHFLLADVIRARNDD